MITKIENYLIETDQNIPNEIGDIGWIIMKNLAFTVAYNLRQINEFKEEPIEVLHIVGGGSKK